jgi:diacylglycerol kinase family enzyme
VPQRYHVEWDGGRYDGDALIVAFANSKQYGNGAQVAPLAALDDGALDCVIVHATGPLSDLWRARKLFTGTILNDRGVAYARVSQATIASEHPLCGHVDGEPVGGATAFELHVRPQALSVCVP